ncbi:MAG: glycosyltransferase family 2 protein [Planctomycetota bacterium]
MRHCALIPAYNEEKNIARVVRGCLAHCPRVLVVDDASEDNTAIRAADAGAVVLRHATNVGKGASLDTGFRYLDRACVDGVVTIDSNGRHDPNELPRFFERAEKGDVDVIVGCGIRYFRDMPWLVHLLNRAASRLASVLSGQLVMHSQSGFRWIRKDVWQHAGVTGRRFDAETQFLINAGKSGFRIAEVPISLRASGGRGGSSPLGDVFRFLVFMGKHVL